MKQKIIMMVMALILGYISHGYSEFQDSVLEKFKEQKLQYTVTARYIIPWQKLTTDFYHFEVYPSGHYGSFKVANTPNILGMQNNNIVFFIFGYMVKSNIENVCGVYRNINFKTGETRTKEFIYKKRKDGFPLHSSFVQIPDVTSVIDSSFLSMLPMVEKNNMIDIYTSGLQKLNSISIANLDGLDYEQCCYLNETFLVVDKNIAYNKDGSQIIDKRLTPVFDNLKVHNYRFKALMNTNGRLYLSYTCEGESITGEPYSLFAIRKIISYESEKKDIRQYGIKDKLFYDFWGVDKNGLFYFTDIYGIRMAVFAKRYTNKLIAVDWNKKITYTVTIDTGIKNEHECYASYFQFAEGNLYAVYMMKDGIHILKIEVPKL